jgi:hypothetical protein
MIHITRSASIAPGKTGEAVAFAQGIIKHFKEKHSVTLEVLMPIGGNPGRIAWLGRYESLAQWEVLIGKLLSDSDYQQMIAKNKDTFLPGTVNDDIWRTI